MKKIFSLMLLLVTIATLSACGDDKESTPIYPAGDLIGTWVHKSTTYNENFDILVSVESTWVFNKNETFTWTVLYKMDDTVLRSNETSGKFAYNGETLTLTTNGEVSKIAASVVGSVLTITTESGSMIHYKK